MGNSFSSKKKNKALNFNKIKTNSNARTSVPNSATGRHSIGIFSKANLVKNNNDKNDIFTQINNRNQLRENIRRSLKIKNYNNDTGDPNHTGNRGVTGYEFYLDYNKIFLGVFPSLHKKRIFKQLEDLNNQIENKENYFNENTDEDNKNDLSRKDYSEKDFYNKHSNGNLLRKKLDFSDESDKINAKSKESEKNIKEGILEEVKNVNVKSFITALIKENTEDFLVSRKNDNFNADEKEEDLTVNKEEKNLKDKLMNENEKNLNSGINQKKQTNHRTCKDRNCLYFSNQQHLNIKSKENKYEEEPLEEYSKTVPNQLDKENPNYNHQTLKNEVKGNPNIKDNNENEDNELDYKIQQNSLNLGLEEVGDFDAANKINSFDLNYRANKNVNCAGENQEEESTINFISNLGTPCKKLDGSDDFELSQETKIQKNLNLNSLMKLINKDSYFETPNSKTAKFEDSIESQNKMEKEIKELKSYEFQAANEALNKSTVSSSKENSKDFICGDCLIKFNLDNRIDPKIIEIDLKIKEGKEKDEIREDNKPKAKIKENLELTSASDYIENNNIMGVEETKPTAKALKSSINIRNNYITKLICKCVWIPNCKPKDHNSIIIFDWDDTLLCTTFLTPNGIFYDNLKIEKSDLEKITKLESLTYNILNSSIEKGDTFIITNAAPGWVEYSAKRFYPKVFPLLSKINIISARGEYEKKHPGDSRQWKILTFLKMVKIIDTRLVTNLICLGDSLIEMEAAHILASKFSQAFIKTVKFRENPTPEELFKQLQLISDQFEHIFSAVKNLTIKVERKNKNPLNNKTNYTSFQNLSNFDLSQIRNSLPNQPSGLKSFEKVRK